MNLANSRRLNDEQLRTAALELKNPLETEGLTDERPDKTYAPTIVAEYQLEPGSEVRCTYCKQRQKHRRGFVAEFAPGARHLIGSNCGETKLDLAFRKAKSSHSDLRARQRYLLRLDRLVNQHEKLIEYCDSILFGLPLKRLSSVSGELEKAAGNSFIRLKALIGSGGMLAEEVRVRDVEAERKRAERLSDDAEPKPIYKNERVQLGPVMGRGVLQAERIRSAVYGLKSEFKALRELRSSDTDSLTTRHLQKALGKVDDAAAKAETAITLLKSAPAFFTPENVERLERWARSYTSGELRMVDGGLQAGKTIISPLQSVEVPGLPDIA